MLISQPRCGINDKRRKGRLRDEDGSVKWKKRRKVEWVRKSGTFRSFFFFVTVLGMLGAGGPLVLQCCY